MNFSVTINNYKGFPSNQTGFEDILPLNIIIGKNNSGKTTLIEVIEYLVKPFPEFTQRVRSNIQPSIVITQPLTLEDIAKVFPQNTSGGGFPSGNHFDYGRGLEGKLISYSVENDLSIKIIDVDYELIEPAKRLINGFAHVINRPFKSQIFRYLTAERDIIPEAHSESIKINFNGNGATNTIQRIINSTKYDSKIVDKTLLTEINSIVNPEIIFTDIVTQFDDSTNRWEIYFENAHNDRIALSKMGSGIKTVLLVLLNLLIVPIIESKPKNQYVFAFEELENNVHPSLLRRLLQYIKDYSVKNHSFIFITTHSNIVIDIFGTDQNAQIVHVKHDGENSTSSTILSKVDQKEILRDLEIKASDLLQSNGIIWVEGPSDRVYINKWIELVDPTLKEGFHYSIMYYGGRILSNLSFDYEAIDRSLIPSLQINQNAFVIIDRDGKRIKPRLNKTKLRIESEVGLNSCWITQGREIENYLTNKSLTKWLTEKYGFTGTLRLDSDKKLGDIINESFKQGKLDYSLHKNKYSSEIVQYIGRNNLNSLDLQPKITLLIKRIKEWNGLI